MSSNKLPGFLISKYPVFLPSNDALALPDDEFLARVRKEMSSGLSDPSVEVVEKDESEMSTGSVLTPSITTTGDVRETLAGLRMLSDHGAKTDKNHDEELENLFMKGLKEHSVEHSVEPPMPDMTSKFFTENGDVAIRSTESPLVDLFVELEEAILDNRLRELLQASWQKDPLITLKIIFNARSIHLGKASRRTLYRSLGWLAATHPITLIGNLRWLTRPIIEKPKKQDKATLEDDIVVIEPERDENDPLRFDTKDGMAHGYWKDLLNILTLAVNDSLDVQVDPRRVLNVHNVRKQWSRHIEERELCRQAKTQADRHAAALDKFEKDPFYRSLHLAVARLFAQQLRDDLALLRSGSPAARRRISLCAKWAPSQRLFHDKHTFIVSSIAELLHPESEFEAQVDRQTYLRYARESYRRDVSALRKQLEVVERDVTAGTFENIKYDRVPSLAMNLHSGTFMSKDHERFDQYLERVAAGKSKISGAVLFPSTLIKAAMEGTSGCASRSRKRGVSGLASEKAVQLKARMVDGQWKTLVQRIKNSGSLDNSIAVCDVSGSMYMPPLSDGTLPVHSSIALSLLVAEVTKAPFGGCFITFSDIPKVQTVDLDRPLTEKAKRLRNAEWGGTTNFTAVFEDLILPMALQKNVKPSDMVKQVIVFSDMQFNQASNSKDRWSSSYERIKRAYEKHGYEMPKLVFWNLAGGRAGYGGATTYDPIAPKPVGAEEPGTALVSGYSQGMLKVFLDGGSFDDAAADTEDDIVQNEVDGGDEIRVDRVAKRQKMDPLSTLMKAVNHPAYDMLKVLD